jgi:DNA repair protein RadC
MAKQVRSEAAVAYLPSKVDNEDSIINQALEILERRMRLVEPLVMASPRETAKYCRLRFGSLEHEVFAIMHLDNRHRLIECQELFRGTIDGASVFPREVVKEVLARNTAAVILVHNHPSGVTEPSRADENITTRLRDALALIDVRVLDHIIATHAGHVSFAERGLI